MLGLRNNFWAGFIDLIPGNNGRKGSEVLPPQGHLGVRIGFSGLGTQVPLLALLLVLARCFCQKPLSNRDRLAKLGLSPQGAGATSSSEAQSHLPAYFPDRRAESEGSLGTLAKSPSPPRTLLAVPPAGALR